MHSLHVSSGKIKNMKKYFKKVKTTNEITRECSNRDDGNDAFFWILLRTLSLAVLFFFVVLSLSYSENKQSESTYYVRGIKFVLAVFAFFLFFLRFRNVHLKNESGNSQHSVFWSLVLYLSVIYELGLIFLLFQSVSYSRELLTYIDPNLNKPVDYKSYGGSCTIWDSGHPDGPLHSVMDKMDGFVVAHLLGWLCKALILRDFWSITILSFVFELLEYTFEHQLPNFSECWWDHWLLDFLFCNGLGIFIGLKLAQYLCLKKRYWLKLHDENRNLSPRKNGQNKNQIQKWSWIQFCLKNKNKFAKIFFICLFFTNTTLLDINVFYLKFIMWLPPSHPLVLLRIITLGILGNKTTTECYQLLTNRIKYVGQHACLLSIIIYTEILVILKYDSQLVLLPPPGYVKYFWLLLFLVIVSISFLNFKFSILGRFAFFLKKMKFVDTQGEFIDNEKLLFDMELEFPNNARKRFNLGKS